jgi:1-deoxy-D-xylulose-5-phosphate reductoisomerase
MAARILLLGSTGSIGFSTLNCVRRNSDEFTIVGLSAGKNSAALAELVAEFRPAAVYIGDAGAKQKLTERFPGLTVFTPAEGLEAFVNNCEFDIMLNALVGAVGLRPTVAALKAGKRIALANKESLVIGGDYINLLLERGRGSIIPVDSEHSAILQCLGGENHSGIESIILTASGGPFRNLPSGRFGSVSPSQALNHPTWNMGKKITIDSATLMNKGFEVIEAHHLFKLSYDALRVWIHPQSIIHSLVEFHDGAVMAQLGLPDMELPIQYALSYPRRFPMNGKRLSLPDIRTLEFFEPDFDRFPCLRHCIDAGRRGGTAPVVVNAANEVAVQAFLDGMISFPEIAGMVLFALDRHDPYPADSLEAIEAADRETRETVLDNFTAKKRNQ